MADISITVLTYDIELPEATFLRIKELIVNRLKFDPLGLTATIKDINAETLRRVLKESLPEEPTLESTEDFRGPLGAVLTFLLDPDTWYSGDGEDTTLVDALLIPAAYIWATEVDAEDSFYSAGLITAQEAEYYVDRMAHAVQRALSGQEQGY